MISAQHVLGKLNTIADSESRVFNDSSDWKNGFPFLKWCEIDFVCFASKTMVATTTEPPGRTSSPPAELETPPEGPSRPSEDSSNVPQTTLSRVSFLRGQYQAMGIQDNVTEILLSAS